MTRREIRRARKRRKRILRICFLTVVMITTVSMICLKMWGSSRQEKYMENISVGAGDLSAYPENMQKLYSKNPDARDYVLDYFENKDKNFEIDLSEYENCSSVPLLMQWDKRWGYREYAGDLFGLTGCGPACLSMAAIYLTGDSSKTPAYMLDYAEQHGYSVDGNGTDWTFISEGAADLGINVTEIPLDENRINQNLEVGNLIICIMGPGDFTESGHFIILTGMKDGEYTVNDPNSYVNSSKTWAYGQISDQIRNLWVLR